MTRRHIFQIGDKLIFKFSEWGTIFLLDSTRPFFSLFNFGSTEHTDVIFWILMYSFSFKRKPKKAQKTSKHESDSSAVKLKIHTRYLVTIQQPIPTAFPSQRDVQRCRLDHSFDSPLAWLVKVQKWLRWWHFLVCCRIQARTLVLRILSTRISHGLGLRFVLSRRWIKLRAGEVVLLLALHL